MLHENQNRNGDRESPDLCHLRYGALPCQTDPPDGEFVVWHIDEDGKGVWGGAYFPDQMDAEWEYASRCFPWFSDNVLFTANEDDDEVEEADEKTA